LFEELGFGGFAVGERHHTPFLSSGRPIVLRGRVRRVPDVVMTVTVVACMVMSVADISH
jgi:hypothetical protein